MGAGGTWAIVARDRRGVVGREFELTLSRLFVKVFLTISLTILSGFSELRGFQNFITEVNKKRLKIVLNERTP